MPYLRSEDTSIYYETAGEGVPTIMLSGMSLDADTWHPVIDRLKNEIRAVGMDLRGSGRSEAPRTHYSIPRMCKDVLHLTALLKLDKVLIVGHSLGGFIALQIARDRPNLVAGLVLASTSATGKTHLLGTTSRAQNALERTLGPFEEVVRNAAEVGFGSKAKTEGTQILEDFVAMRLARPPRGRGYVGQRKASLEFDIRRELHQITCPAIVLHGNEDEIISIANGKNLASGLPVASFRTLDGVGHFPQLEAPELVVEGILDLKRRTFIS